MTKKKIDTWPLNLKIYTDRFFQLFGILFLIGSWEFIKAGGLMGLIFTIINISAAIILYVFIPSIEWQGVNKIK